MIVCYVSSDILYLDNTIRTYTHTAYDHAYVRVDYLGSKLTETAESALYIPVAKLSEVDHEPDGSLPCNGEDDSSPTQGSAKGEWLPQ